MEIPTSIKDRILEIVQQALSQFTTDEDKKELFENSCTFIDEDTEQQLIQDIVDFANRPEISPIANKNLRFSQPPTFNMPNGVVSVRMSLQGAGNDLVDIFDDFVLYTTRLLSESGYNSSQLQEAWENFERDFFQDEVEAKFYTSLATCYYHSGGIIEDMIPDPNINVRFLHTGNIKDKIIYFLLKPAAGSEEVSIIIEYTTRMNKNERLERYFHEAAAIFDKVTFTIRTVCGGSAHFDFVKPIFFGNLATQSELVQNYPSNHLFTNADATTIGRIAPEETWITRLWSGIATRDIFQWQFASQKIRDSHSRVNRNDQNYFFDKSYQLTRQLEKLVDLIQALENVIGDYGKDNPEYVGIINARGNAQMQTDIQDKLTSLYTLRNKYLHGRPTGTDSVESVFNTDFHGRIEELETGVNMLDFNLRKIIMVSIMNVNFKDEVLTYHRGQGRTFFDIATGTPRRDKRPAVVAFPTFNTIYY